MAHLQALILLFLVPILNQVYSAGREYDTFQVFLVDGSIASEGRVEIVIDGDRGTVCGDRWSLNKARVFCRMLEYDGALSAPGNATFGQGSGDIYDYKGDCVGTEDHLLDCPSLMATSESCTHAEDAGAICYSEAPFRVRLGGGSSMTEGRVELMYDGSWGTICDHAWGLKDATVVCRMLGFEGALDAPGNASFGRGSGNVLLDGVTCDGSEDNLAECSHDGVGVHDCNHGEDAGVKCFSGDPFKVRLIGGPDDSEGRVEIFYDGSWQTVCDNNWDFKEARVVCRMLGFDGALDAPRAAAYGQGSGGILLDNLGCDGTEEKIADCYHRGVGVHNCDHANDAGVRCFSGTDPFQVRLMGSVDDDEGRVEVLYDGSWGTICDSDWDIRDATVVCRMLDFDGALEATHSARFGKGFGDSILEGVRCSGTEGHLAECLHGGFGSNVCDHEKDAGAICYSNVRLVGGSDDAEGRVEIQHMGVWGTICHDHWDILDATVVCKMLGFQGALKAPGSAYFGKGTGAIHLDDVQCEGTESRLMDCKHKGIGEHNCAHTEDASVVCDNKGGMAVKTIVGAVLGTSIMILIIIGVVSLVHCRRKKTKDRAEENPSPFEVSKTTGPTKDLAQGEGVQIPPNPPNRPLTLPRISLKKDVKPGETMYVYQSPKPEHGDLDDIDEEGKHLYMSMESKYLAPSAVKDDVCIPSLDLGSDASRDVPATAEESVYMGDQLVEADDLSETDNEASVVQDETTRV